jgi:cyanophycin synthetase
MNYDQEIDRFIPKLVVSEQVDIASGISPDEYEKWINCFFAGEKWQEFELISQNKFNTDFDVRVVQTTLNLFLYFLRVLRIPIFNFHYVKVNKAATDVVSSSYMCSIAFSKLDYFPEIFQPLFKQVISINRYISTNSFNEKNVEFIFNQIQSQLVKPFQKKTPGGKSTFPVLESANSRDIPFLHLGRGIYQLGFGSKKHVFDRSYSELNSTYGTILAQGKFGTTNYIKSAGFPTPKNILVSDLKEAQQAAISIGFPVVVKPIDLDRGEGVSVNINTEGELSTAFSHAMKLSRAKKVLVEKMISGVCHRLFIANHKLLYAVKRLPYGVHGDGSQTISQLVQEKIRKEDSKAPWKREIVAELDHRALDAISNLGFNTNTIPAPGVFVPLRLIESTADGGVDVDMTTHVNRENLDAAIEISKLFGLSEVGVDFITDDVSVPWYKNGAAFNEVNVAPLLGGGEISRGYIPNFLQSYFNDNGRIKIEIEENLEIAHSHHKTLVSKGLRTFLVSESIILDSSGDTVVSACDEFEDKVKSILYRIDCDALVICHSREDN